MLQFLDKYLLSHRTAIGGTILSVAYAVGASIVAGHADAHSIEIAALTTLMAACRSSVSSHAPINTPTGGVDLSGVTK